MLLFFEECKVYDLSTAMFFAVSLGLLARGKFGQYYVLFPLACLNRETTFLLAILFTVYYFSRLERRDWVVGIAYQGFVFIGIRLWLMDTFAENAGVPFLFRLQENAADHVKYPWQSLLFFVAVLAVLWMCMRSWHTKPIFLRTAFAIFAPALMVLYLLFGWAFEVRVFAEMYPLAVVMATWEWLP